MKNWIPPEGFLIEFASNSAEETFALGRRIAASVEGGSVIALRGELGSGKTCLAKGIAAGLGIGETVTSPTYTIIREYEKDGSPALFHIDAYRLEDDDDFIRLGGDEIISGGGISVIEWSEKIPKSLPEDAVTIAIEITGPSSRILRISGLESL